MRDLASSCSMLTLALVLSSGCGHDWDAFDPRADAAGPGATVGSGGAGSGGEGGDAAGGSGAGAGGAGTAGGGGGGEGGGPPTTCGGTSLLASTFDDPEALALHFELPDGASLVNGELVIALPTDGSGTWRGLSSYRFHDLRDDTISVEVLEMVSTDTTAYVALYAEKDEQNYLEIFQQEGTLVAARTVDGSWQEVGSADYDPSAHRFWRIRETAGTVHWETSPDGSVWATMGTLAAADLFSLQHVRVELAAGTDGGEVMPGTARFDDLDGGTASGSWCKASSHADDFEDGAWPSWGGWYGEQGCSFSEEDGAFTVTPALAPVASSYCTLWGEVGFDLRDDAIQVHVEQMGELQVAVQAIFAITDLSGHWLAARQTDGGLQLLYDSGLGETEADSVPYDARTQPFWQLREEGGTLTMSTSQDGVAWQTAMETPTPFDVSVVEVIIGAGAWQPVTAPGTLRIAGYNVP